MTLRADAPVREPALAFKAYEIEELADRYFFRPLGYLIALAAQSLGFTPTSVTVIGGAIGIVGGTLLYDERLGLAAFALIVLHSVFDSADGQLARLTGQITEFGRLFDGIAGYMTHAAVYTAIVAGFVSRGGHLSLIWWALPSAFANMLHAQLYDYYRTSYADIAVKGLIARSSRPPQPPKWGRRILRSYDDLQERLFGLHGEVEATIGRRAQRGRVRDEDRALYRATFYWPVRGWNFLGDNTRIYAIGVLAWIHHLEWFFAFVLIPMNIALIGLSIWQRRADRRFLDLVR